MAWQFPQSTTLGTTVAFLDEDSESVFVASNVFIAVDAPGFATIDGRANNHRVVIAGTVANNLNTAISIGLDPAIQHGSVITVEATGQVRSFDNSGAIRVNGFDMHLVNHGLITSDGFAIVFNGQAATGVSSIVNTGVIDAVKVGISHGGSGTTTETLTLLNSGTISGSEAYDSLAVWIAKDEITNTGTMIGNIFLGGGDDLYDGHLGTIDGDVHGDIGNDRIYSGAGKDNLLGEDGNDTLIGGGSGDTLDGGSGLDRASYGFASKGVFASLTSPATNKGDAAGDSYVSIENLTGSDFNDKLGGSAGRNAIIGGAGDDIINGAAGKDTLTGSAGKDTFVFDTALNATTNVDAIKDFSFTDDTIQLENAVFTGLTATGILAAAAFKANATGLADDSSDRVVYETDTGKLFYDADGLDGSAGVLFAQLGIGLGLTNADFVVT